LQSALSEQAQAQELFENYPLRVKKGFMFVHALH